MSIEKLIDESVLKMLRHRARQRAHALNKEARGYWHSDRDRFHQLKARAVEFNRLSNMFEELKDPLLPAFPALPEAQGTNASADRARRIIKKKREEAPLEFKLFDN